MKKFHFTLDSILTLRQRQEHDATANYAESLLAQQQSVMRLSLVENELTASREEMRGKLLTGCAASEIAHALIFHRATEKRRDDCVSNLHVAERQVNAALQAMLAARQQREVVEKFFDKQKKRFNYECAQEERKFMDDLASGRSASPLSWVRA